jgi:hypothetical protein
VSAFELTKLALQFTQFCLTFNDGPGTSLTLEGRTRRGQCDAAQSLRAPAAVGHGGEVIEERFMFGFLFVLQLGFAAEFVCEPEFLFKFRGG